MNTNVLEGALIGETLIFLCSNTAETIHFIEYKQRWFREGSIPSLIQNIPFKPYIKFLFQLEEKEHPAYTKWLESFKEIHGNLDTQRKIKLKKLSSTYNIEIDSQKNLFKLIYCMDNLYGTILVLFAAKALTEDFQLSFLSSYLLVNYLCRYFVTWRPGDF